MDIVSSQIVYHGRVFDVRIDQVRLPNGNLHQMDIVQHHPAVTMIPIDQEENIWFVRQFRHPANSMLLELPAGMLEKDEEPALGAQREIREETGMASGRLEEIGGFFLAPGYSSEYMHVFLARDLILDPLPGDEDEDLEIVKIPKSKLQDYIDNGEIRDAKSLGALYLAMKYLR